MMNGIRLIVVAGLGAVSFAVGAAGTFDGSRPLICASMSVFECVPGGECLGLTPQSIDAPEFLRIDFKKKIITTTRGSDDPRTSKIERMEAVDNQLFLQGVEDGREDMQDGLGWSLSVAEPSGKMTLSAVGEHVVFVIFGACTPQ